MKTMSRATSAAVLVVAIVVALAAGGATLWLLGPQDCVTLGQPSAFGTPCPNRFGDHIPLPILWLAGATAALGTGMGTWWLLRR